MGDSSASSYATLLNGVSSAYSGHQAGKLNDSMARFNAKIADMQAADAMQRAGVDEVKLRNNVQSTLATQRAGYASQGVVVDQDTAAELARQTAAMRDVDVMTIRNNARQEAWGYKVQAINDRLGGLFGRLTADNQARQTLLTSGAKAYDLYNAPRKNTAASSDDYPDYPEPTYKQKLNAAQSDPNFKAYQGNH
jgi:hypothetical protein